MPQRHSRSALLHCSSVLLLVFCGTAGAWDSNVPLPAAASARFFPIGAAVDDAGRLWATGHAPVGIVVVRYDGAGTTPLVLRDADEFGYLPQEWVRTAGGMVGFADDGGSCGSTLKYDAEGTFRWRRQIVPCSSWRDLMGPNLWPAGADGAVWMRTGDGAARLGSDGRMLVQIKTFDSAHVDDVDPRDGRVFTSTIDRTDGKPLVTAYDRNGTALWRWHGSNGAGLGGIRAGVAGDGSLRVAGIDTQGLFVAAVGIDGGTLWNRTVAPTATLGTIKALHVPRVDTTGASWVALESDDASAPALAMVTRTGETRFVRDLTSLGQAAKYTSVPRARLTPDDELILSRRGTVSRIAGDGTLRYARALAPDSEGPVEPFVDIADVDAAGAATFVVRPVDGQLRFARLSAQGAELSTPLSEVPSAEPSDATRVVLPDGSLLAWTRDSNGTRELIRLRTDGSIAWRVPTPGTWAPGAGNRGALAASTDRACALDARQAGPSSDMVLTCYATADGTTLWSRTLLAAAGSPDAVLSTRLSLDADGTASAWYGKNPSAPAVDHVRLDRNGVILATRTWPSATLHAGVAFDSPFALLLTATERIVVDRTGSERYRVPAAGVSAAGTIAFDADGGFVAAARSASQTQLLRRFDAGGTQRWSREITPTTRSVIPFAVGAGGVFVQSCCTPFGYPQRRYALTRLALDTGNVTWTRDYPTSSVWFGLALSPAADAVVSIHNGLAGRIVVDVVDPATGDLRKRHSETCREPTCAALSPIVDARSRLHFIERANVGTSALVGWQLPSPQARDVRLDQPGIAGAWWAPYANGEGFVLDWLPASRTLFMPWFTFSVEGGNDPSGQRWYAVAGEVPANATSAELPITEAVGGAFDDPQTVTRRIVGRATLNFSDCDNGTLQYAFDAPYNYAAKGIVTLSRLAPATQDCVLADGTVQSRTATPANGFDARMSGSWYEEATSGQGLQFTVQPGGIFFAPWFTFDPKGASDDPDNKRWFSIQGSLANAANGVAELPIAQAIGGVFDRTPTNNFSVVGKATLTMQGCDRARIDYRFDDNELAGAMRGKAGTLDLAKAGGCMP